MTRRLTLLAAVMCFALSAWIVPDPPSQGRGVLGAIGSSMGGFRVMVVDALFLRAESQKRAGRIEEAAALYETVLELDPENDTATIFLVNVYVDELMPQVPGLEDRFRWWLEARALLERALKRRQGSPALNARAGSLIQDAVIAEPDFAPMLARRFRLPGLVALRHLMIAVRATETLPRQGRGHLLRVALLAPALGADAVAAGPAARRVLEEAVAAGRETLTLRGEVLSQMRLDERTPGNLQAVLSQGLAAVEAVRKLRQDGGSLEEARLHVAALRAHLGDASTVRRLEALLED